MMVSKITELTVFESPDGGRTVYARAPGQSPTERKLHWRDPKYQRELEELEQQKRWVMINQARATNPELDRLCEQAEILFELSRKAE
jgi:hypothetical protein